MSVGMVPVRKLCEASSSTSLLQLLDDTPASMPHIQSSLKSCKLLPARKQCKAAQAARLSMLQQALARPPIPAQ
jgi:hypothetical protein